MVGHYSIVMTTDLEMKQHQASKPNPKSYLQKQND